MENQFMSINLGYITDTQTNYLVNISHNYTREIFLRFLWKKGLKPSYFYDGIADTDTEPINIDHISFHKDRTQTTPSRVIKDVITKHISELGENEYGPLLIVSVYDTAAVVKNIGRMEPLIIGNSSVNYTFELQGKNQFSLVGFIVGPKVNYKTMLERNFPGIFILSASLMLLNYFGKEQNVIFNELGEVSEVKDIGLLIGFTNKVIPHPKVESLMSKQKRSNITRAEHMLGLNISPISDERIKRLV